ncbi:MAG: AMP-binding protein [Deltaproteobacteria bacterium]|nr:AMP-binding protein [Deltaproteobacteria bacterium]MBW1931009.1 AMP-binding protein [Deltaproteobacteria bacterium]MBW2126060.1 AMP-binding protein [Deltaproteobacteria bacterium]
MTNHLEKKLWNEKIETLSRDELRALQLKRLKAQVRYNYERSSFYKAKFDQVGARPEDIQSFEDFAKIPLMTKDEHRQAQEESIERYGNPYALLACAPKEKIIRINATSGTTGTPTLYTLTRHDVEIVNEMHARKYWRAGIRPGDVMLQALSLSMFTGGLPLSQGIMHMGACVVPVGIEGGTKRVLQFLRLTSPVAIIATPSFGQYLIERCPELTGKPATELGLRWFFCAGEPGGGNPEVRKVLAEGFGAKVFDHTGGGHAFHGISCDEPPEQFSGMHFVSEDHCLLELVDPETKEPIEIEDGAVGEMVFTFLDWEGGPFMRYALGDILQVFTKPCACGMPGIRFKIIGRADEMLIVKGVNVYPEAIRTAILKFSPRVTGYFRILLDKPGPLVQPPLNIRIEYGVGVKEKDLSALEQEMTRYFREEIRVTPKFQWVPPETLPREKKKTRYIEVRGKS